MYHEIQITHADGPGAKFYYSFEKAADTKIISCIEILIVN